MVIASFIISMSICSVKKTPFCVSNIVGIGGHTPETTITNDQMSVFQTSEPISTNVSNLTALTDEELRASPPASEVRTTMAMAMLNIPIMVLLLIQSLFSVLADSQNLEVLHIASVVFDSFTVLTGPVILIMESKTLRKRINRMICTNINRHADETIIEPSFQMVTNTTNLPPRDDAGQEQDNIPTFLQGKSEMLISVKVLKNNRHTSQEAATCLSLSSTFSFEIESRDGNNSSNTGDAAVCERSFQVPKRSYSLDSVSACAGSSVDQSRRCSLSTEPNTPMGTDNKMHVYVLPAMLIAGSHSDLNLADLCLDMNMKHPADSTKKTRRSTVPSLNTAKEYSKQMIHTCGLIQVTKPNAPCELCDSTQRLHLRRNNFVQHIESNRSLQTASESCKSKDEYSDVCTN